MDKNKLLLPWYINETLSENEKTSIEMWMQRDASATENYQTTLQLSQIFHSQESQAPSTQVRAQLLTKIQKQPILPKNSIHPWLWGSPMMLLIFILLWLIVQPGTILKWSTNGTMPATFLIYRAPAGSAQYILIEELTDMPKQPTYQYADLLVVPGQAYQYLIEVRDQHGNSTLSQAALSDSQMTLAAQIAILLTSFILTYGIIIVIQEIKTYPQLNLSILI